MAEERIDIIIRENGSRVVKRNIRDVGRESRTAASGVHYLKRALAGIGAVLIVRELTQLLDTYTNLQNRIRATGSAGEELTDVYKQLLAVSNETRQSLEGTGAIYTRLAVSSKELGTTTGELIAFTKSLNQAVSLSGATSKEALAALIQLSQGMASGQLRGDELRSVLEQLPAVADVIAVKLGVARGALREVAEQGKITAKVILEAFRDAREELNERFAKSIPTIGQAMNVLKNQVIDVLGTVNKELGITSGLTSAIITLALSMDGLADSLILIGRVGTVAAAVFGTLYAAQKVSQLSAAVSGWLEYRRAIAAGTAVALGSAEAERQKSAAVLSGAVAASRSSIATLKKAQADQAAAATALAQVRATQAQLVAERQLEVVRLQAQITDIGRMKSLTRLAEIRRAEAAMVSQLATAEGALAKATAAATAAQRGALGASSQLAGARGALNETTKKAAGSTSLLGQALAGVTARMAALNAVIIANPITALLTVIVGVTAALTVFRDQIKLGVDDVTTLGDLMRAFGDDVGKAFDDLWVIVKDTVGPVVDLFDGMFEDINFSLEGFLRLAAQYIDGYIGIWAGAINVIKTLFDRVPGAFADSSVRAFNIVLGKVSSFIDEAVKLFNPLLELAGLDTITTTLDFRLENNYEGQAENLGKDVSDAFLDGFQGSNAAESYLDDLLKRSKEIAKERIAAEEAATHTQPTSGGGEANDKLAKSLDQLLGRYNSVIAAQQEYTEAFHILDSAVKANMITEEQRSSVLELIHAQLEDQLYPMAAINRELDEQTQLLRMTNQEREVETQLRDIQQDLLTAGIVLNETELAQMRERLGLIQEETTRMEARNRVLQQVTGPQKEFTNQLAAINDLLKSGDLTREQANQYLVESQGTLLEGTIEHQQAMLTAHQEQYARIDEMRQADLLSEQSAAQVKKKLDAELLEKRLSGAKSFYGNLSVLAKSENRALAAIGKGAAVTQATIDGVVAVQKALASAPPPANYALAASVGVATAANIAKIMAQTPGFAFGGEFTVGGQGGTDSQMVAFRATPGERVAISTPQQDRDRAATDNNNGSGQGSGDGLTLVNLTDPALLGDYLSTVEGEKLFVNVLRRNSDALKGILGG